jgi:hypothetical protein
MSRWTDTNGGAKVIFLEAAMLELKPDEPVCADYEQDLVLWYEHQVELLRERRFEQLDLVRLIEELEAIVKCQRRELASRLEVLLMHLLKCQFQHRRISGSWLGTLAEQRSEIAKLLEESPSLVPSVTHLADKVYPKAVQRAAAETRLKRDTFPVANPYSIEQVFNDDFVP